jgi:AcrR family transcriptional regulator
MPRTVDREVKSEAILRAAARVFAREGFRDATIDGIAAKAGIGKGTVYEYFRSKQDLFFAVFENYMAGLESVGRRHTAAPARGAAAQIRQAVHAILASGADARDLFPLLFEFWSASASPDRRKRVASLFRKSYKRFRNLLAGPLIEGQRSGEFDRRVDPGRIAAVLVGALDGLFLQSWFDRNLDPVPAGDEFVGVILRGLARKS